MKRTEFDVGVRFDILGKDEAKIKRFGESWFNQRFTLDQLIDHFRKGYAFTHPCRGGKKDTAHFLHADLLVADVDGTMTLDQALANDFIKSFAGFISTTASHSEQGHRFRIIFPLERRISDAKIYKALHEGMQKEFSSDSSASSVAQGFFGAVNPTIIPIGKSLPESKINALIDAGMSNIKSIFKQANHHKINESTQVTTGDNEILPISSLSKGTSIYCPFGTHPDSHHSAHIVLNDQGIKGVHCRSCGETQWTKPSAPQPERFDTFDRLVDTYAGKANSHFEYTGLGEYNHDLETNLGKSNFHVFNTEHVELPIDVPGIHLVKSPKGTGKTQALVRLMDAFKDPAIRKKHHLTGRSILVGHRQSLIKESAEKLGMECYLDTRSFDKKVVMDPENPGQRTTEKPIHYAICLDSLHSRLKLQYEHYDIVILDESEQVFSHFLSRKMDAPAQNFSVLSRIIRNAKYVFCLDADIDRITMSGIVSCLRNHPSLRSDQTLFIDESKKKKIYFHRNDFKKAAGSIELYPSPSELKTSLINDLKSGKRCFIASNSKAQATEMYQAALAKFPEKKFQLVTSEVSSDAETQAFIKHIKSEILNFDAVFGSPTIGTGIDITFPNNQTEIDVVYGFFNSNINTHFDIDQQLARVRHPRSVKVYIDGRIGKKKTDFHTIKRELLDNHTVKGLGYSFGIDGAEWDESDHPFIDLYTEVEIARRKSMNFLKSHFLEYKKNQGWSFSFIESNESAHELGSAINRAGKKLRQKSRIDNLMGARQIPFKEFMRLKDNKRKSLPVSREEGYALERYRIEHLYDEDISPALIEFDNEGKTESKIWLFQRITDPKLSLTHFSEISTSQVEMFNYSSTMNETDFKRIMFLREAFSAAGVYDLESKTFDCHAIYDKDSLSGFVSFIRKHEERLQLLFDKPINSDLDERSVNQLKTLLRLVGLDQVRVKANKGGGISRYRINPSLHDKLYGISSKLGTQKDTSQTGE